MKLAIFFFYSSINYEILFIEIFTSGMITGMLYALNIKVIFLCRIDSFIAFKIFLTKRLSYY